MLFLCLYFYIYEKRAQEIFGIFLKSFYFVPVIALLSKLEHKRNFISGFDLLHPGNFKKISGYN